jgi:UDPglucose 6-dehydrogenase
MEKAHLHVYDPKVTAESMREELAYAGVPKETLDRYLVVENNPYAACEKAHAIAVLTEWDEFRALDFARIHESMFKPAFVFDGRNILDAGKLGDLGFDLYSIGKGK